MFNEKGWSSDIKVFVVNFFGNCRKAKWILYIKKENLHNGTYSEENSEKESYHTSIQIALFEVD